jgi:hypothetical protein
LHEEERGGGVAQPEPLVQHLRQGGERLVQVTGAGGERRGRAGASVTNSRESAGVPHVTAARYSAAARAGSLSLTSSPER